MDERRNRFGKHSRSGVAGLWAVAALGIVLASGAARAVQVEVTYTLDASPQNAVTTIANGAPITSLTAKLIATFPTLSASTWSGTPSLESLIVYAPPVGTPYQSGSGYNPGGTFSLPGLPAAADSCGSASCAWLRTGSVPLGFGYGTMATSHLGTFVNVGPGAGQLTFSARQKGGGTPYSSGSGPAYFQLTTQVIGVEVSRTLVPEPDANLLLLAGGAAVFGAAGIRRWRRSR